MFVDEEAYVDIAFPHGKVQQALFFNPFEVAFVAFDLVARPVGAYEDVHMFVVVDVMHKGDDAAIALFSDGESCLFPHLAQHAVFRALPFLELAAHAEPFVVVEVVLFLGAVQHEVLATALQIA